MSLSTKSDTRWLTQTKAGGGHVPPEERGDCVAACIGSILGLPLEKLPNPHGDDWWHRWQAALAPLGYGLAEMDVRYDPPDEGLWIASVPSLNLPADPDGKPALHCIVCKGRRLVHDPALGEKYDDARWVEAWNDDKVAAGWVLVQLDPMEAAA